MTRRLMYLAHPVAGDVSGNIARVLRWYKALTLRHPDHVYVIPWLPDVMAFDDSNPADRAAGFARNMMHIERADGIVLVGGRISRGMAVELAAAERAGKLVLDLTDLGPEPPK
jgi:hypothetical protein